MTAIRVVDLTQVKADHLPRLAYPRFRPGATQGAGTTGGSAADTFFGGSATG